jgi:hypothetical protein
MRTIAVVAGLLASAALAAPSFAGGPAAAEPALVSAVRKGDAAAVRALVAAGADARASTASGWTPLMEAAARGRDDIARALLEAGADVDARDRVLGTALDVATQSGHPEIVRLLRGRGARGSGRSLGDTVCSRRWSGQGFCGVIEAAEATRYRVRVERLVGCASGCSADADCSEGRPVGGPRGIGEPDVVSIRSWCLTDTQVPPR